MFSGSSVSKEGWVRKPERKKSKKSSSHAPKIKHPNPDNDFPHLHPRCYEGRFLARMIRRQSKHSIWQNLTREQKEQVKKGFPQGNLPPLRNKEREQVLEELFTKWLAILDTMFFFGTVKYKVKFRFDSDPEAQDYHGFWGQEGDVYNMVFNYRNSKYQGLQGWENLLSKMVHESLHAFLQIYSCQCLRCLEKGWSQETAIAHNAVWANSMIAIQDALNRDLGLQIDCKISDSVKLEMKNSDWIPRNEQLKRWGIHDVAGRKDEKADSDGEEETGEKRPLLAKGKEDEPPKCNMM